MARGFRGNGEKTVVTNYSGPDGYAVAVSRGLATFWNTLSPASRGPAGTRTGLVGYGVNRAGAWTAPLQNFRTAVRPVIDPMSLRLGIGAGVGGQPGLPNTASVSGTPSWLLLMAAGQTAGKAGLGG